MVDDGRRLGSVDRMYRPHRDGAADDWGWSDDDRRCVISDCDVMCYCYAVARYTIDVASARACDWLCRCRARSLRASLPLGAFFFLAF